MNTLTECVYQLETADQDTSGLKGGQFWPSGTYVGFSVEPKRANADLFS